MLYALEQQATHGPCRAPAPRGWAAVEAAKHRAWRELGGLAKLEAMRLFVRTLDEEQPEWWARLPPGWEAAAAAIAAGAAPEAAAEAAAAGAAAVAAAAAGGGAGGGAGGTLGAAGGGDAVLREGAWVVVPQDGGRRPLPRYEQGAALLGARVFVLGGHYAGRYLGDLWTYDLTALQWAQAAAAAVPTRSGDGVSGGSSGNLSSGVAAAAAATGEKAGAVASSAAAAPPPSAGHSVTPWRGRLLVVGGHTKDKDPAAPIAVRALDPATMEWSLLQTSGDVPCARGGHTVRAEEREGEGKQRAAVSYSRLAVYARRAQHSSAALTPPTPHSLLCVRRDNNNRRRSSAAACSSSAARTRAGGRSATCTPWTWPPWRGPPWTRRRPARRAAARRRRAAATRPPRTAGAS